MSLPSRFMAAFSGIGLLDRPSIARQRGNSLACRSNAAAGSPVRKASIIAVTSAGTTFPATLTAPLPPTLRIGSVRLSSPLSTVRSLPAQIALAWSRSPVDSFTATIVVTSASRQRVSGSMFFPVRPGML